MELSLRQHLMDPDLIPIRVSIRFFIEYILPFFSTLLVLFELGLLGAISSNTILFYLVLIMSTVIVRYDVLRIVALDTFVFDLLNQFIVRALALVVVLKSLVLIDGHAVLSNIQILQFTLLHSAFTAVFSYLLLKLGLIKKIRMPNQKLAIVGVTDHGLLFLQQLGRYPHLALEFAGFVESRDDERLPNYYPYKILSKVEEVAPVVQVLDIRHVVITFPETAQERIAMVVNQLLDTTCTVHYLNNFLIFKPIREHLTRMGGIAVYTLIDVPRQEWGRLCKRALDIVLSLLAIIALMPLFLVVALLIKVDSDGPVLFKQKRWGVGAQSFYIYKFRSMSNNPQINGGFAQATLGDFRVTRIGAILRRTSIDELPQLFNILRGDMSIVGPRPHVIQQNEEYRALIRGYMLRHKVRPGLTGWAQVNGCRGETETLDKMAKRIEYDLDYVRRWSLVFDAYIILRTVYIVIKRTNAY